MQDTAVEKIVAEFERLSFEQQTEVYRRLEEKLAAEPGAKRSPRTPRFVGHYTPKNRTKEHEWLRLHRDEYAWQWVALDGDRLIGQGYDLKKVAEDAKRNGVEDALFVRVEPSDALPWAGF